MERSTWLQDMRRGWGQQYDPESPLWRVRATYTRQAPTGPWHRYYWCGRVKELTKSKGRGGLDVQK